VEPVRKVHRLSALERHHRQAAWQIWVPVILAAALVITLFVFSVLATVYNYPISKTLAPVAVIWVLLPNCFGGLFTLAFLGGLVFTAGKLLQGLPQLGNRVLHALDRLQALVQALSDRLASPVLTVNGWIAGWSKLWESIWPKRTH